MGRVPTKTSDIALREHTRVAQRYSIGIQSSDPEEREAWRLINTFPPYMALPLAERLKGPKMRRGRPRRPAYDDSRQIEEMLKLTALGLTVRAAALKVAESAQGTRDVENRAQSALRGDTVHR